MPPSAVTVDAGALANILMAFVALTNENTGLKNENAQLRQALNDAPSDDAGEE